ncbi:hypothetical protein LX87_04107 [Larkinella arboricola]|uniref:Uncharacterized protein n=1 Tax=Larkinella arboricola TaxID=643671 RepID=A0A327WSB4_LARAB|nr:hypothetical protein [Larkinella arboricola]RAJ94222.1 hypothetical protein LX87_04107 [Larkinella arboricola]
MTFAVPVKPYIKEFFQNSDVFGPEPINVRRNSRLGEIIAAIFSSYPLQDVDLEELAPTEILNPDYLNFTLSFPIEHRLLTDAKLTQLGKVLEVIFEFYAIAFVKGRMDVFPSLNGAAERFTHKHQISVETYTSDAVRKLVGRSQVKNDVFFNKLSVREKSNLSKVA